MKDILVIRLSAIGDILLTTPVLAHLKKLYPQANIHYLVKGEYQNFIAACPDADYFILWKKEESLFSVAKRIRALEIPFDLVVDLQSNLKTRILAHLFKAKIRRRYVKPYLNRIFLVYFKINRYKEIKKTTERYLDALKGLDDTRLTETIHLNRKKLPAQIERFAKENTVVIAPGAKWMTKRWPEEYFASLASKILEKHPKEKIVWLGGPDEIPLFDFFKKHPYLLRHQKRMLFLSNVLGVEQMATLADSAQVIICNDSGLMHLLSTSNTPLVALFLSTAEEFGFFPLAKNAEVLMARNIECRPCSHKGLPACPKKHFRCGRELTADEVYTTVSKHFHPASL
ncbi:MAG: Lipopolysaccharide core heptosyltransferase RfaQ [Turneriella sp.]|nr:Lipopolysaccharide core heptosyltransferase RfaQ [Turneriella sp.]